MDDAAAQPRPCFNHELIDEIMTLARAAKDSGLPIDFWVTGSLIPQIYNVGGDLNFFSEAIRGGRREALRAYARACVDCVHAASRGFDTGAISLAMIEGTALGGGFEAALAHHFVLAQNNARMGFPEMAFNLFPGMGGYSLVARRSGMRLAEELIGTGESHTAEWFQARGLVDVLFEPGDAYKATRTFIDVLRPKLNGTRAMLRAPARAAAVALGTDGHHRGLGRGRLLHRPEGPRLHGAAGHRAEPAQRRRAGGRHGSHHALSARAAGVCRRRGDPAHALRRSGAADAAAPAIR